jgi:hypothetical protein
MFEDSNPNLGMFDMRVELPENAPKSLHKHFNSHICNKGGGSTTTVSSGIDPEFKPYLERVLKDVTGRYEADVKAGPGATVAALDPRQIDAIKQQTALAQQAMTGTGLYDTQAAQQRDLQNIMGSAVGQASAGGALGSARAQKSMQGALADRALEYQQRRQQEAAAGVQSLGEAGTTLQQYEQQLLDAPHTSASRYFGYLGSAPQTQTMKSSGGGK